MKTLKCYLNMCDLYEEAEGQAQEGWFCPIWASIDEENECIEVSLGAAVSQNTSFINNDGEVPASWVGRVPCWFRYYKENDAEQWAEDTGCSPNDFDSDIEMETEVDCWDLTEEINEVENNIKEYAKSEGFYVEFE